MRTLRPKALPDPNCSNSLESELSDEIRSSSGLSGLKFSKSLEKKLTLPDFDGLLALLAPCLAVFY